MVYKVMEKYRVKGDYIDNLIKDLEQRTLDLKKEFPLRYKECEVEDCSNLTGKINYRRCQSCIDKNKTTRSVKERREFVAFRDVSLFHAWIEGTSVKKLSEDYHLSVSRCDQIIKRQMQEVNSQAKRNGIHVHQMSSNTEWKLWYENTYQVEMRK